MFLDQKLPSAYLSVTAVLAVGCVIAFSTLVHKKRDSRPGLHEPTSIHSNLPFIGHLFGLIGSGARYFEDVK